jgi:hypothetical protein
LERSTGQNQTVSCGIMLRKSLRQLALRVLHTMTFVYEGYESQLDAYELKDDNRTDDHVDPSDATQSSFIFDNILVRSQKDLELIHPDLPLQLLPDRGAAFVHESIDGGRPLPEFVRPIRESGERDDDEVRGV